MIRMVRVSVAAVVLLAVGVACAPTALPTPTKETVEVKYGDRRAVGAQQKPVVICNNINAHNPTWNELIAFLKADRTNDQLCVPGSFSCAEYSVMLHDNAEAKDIRAALVLMEINRDGGTLYHSLNAFDVVNDGLVFIDAVAPSWRTGVDKVVYIEVGKEYKVVGIIDGLPPDTFGYIGIVEEIQPPQW